jgi:hypothetical protein
MMIPCWLISPMRYLNPHAFLMRITQTTPNTCYLNLDLLNPGEIEHLPYRFPLVVDFPLEIQKSST